MVTGKDFHVIVRFVVLFTIILRSNRSCQYLVAVFTYTSPFSRTLKKRELETWHENNKPKNLDFPAFKKLKVA